MREQVHVRSCPRIDSTTSTKIDSSTQEQQWRQLRHRTSNVWWNEEFLAANESNNNECNLNFSIGIAISQNVRFNMLKFVPPKISSYILRLHIFVFLKKVNVQLQFVIRTNLKGLISGAKNTSKLLKQQFFKKTTYFLLNHSKNVRQRTKVMHKSENRCTNDPDVQQNHEKKNWRTFSGCATPKCAHDIITILPKSQKKWCATPKCAHDIIRL